MTEDWETQWSRTWSNVPLWWAILWRGYRKLLKEVDLDSPKIMELGCGSGRTSLALAKLFRGEVTLVDNSKAAISKAKQTFRNQNIKTKFIIGDLFSLRLKGGYDLVHSEGLIEHFKGERLDELIKLHCSLCNSKGYVIIFAPTPSKIYKTWRFLQERLGVWYYGDEKPMMEDELKNLCERNGLHVVKTVKTPFQVGVLCKPST
ncbi:MAG: class I SAM-dependent methyltransferase [Candidatus Odinarchaeum yellowstonii]|uniref:Class I SAM-dependent methyltransferase n=1 Tax=Odinarchaeota yellowstonii (strain LCB_4) TaxID=1841599 RepID=A0AAF0IB70_ODILC|nr:MAG: class I SAM-dependent methyltransferase [Candidatus Odinarchaeum yellowstonii]